MSGIATSEGKKIANKKSIRRAQIALQLSALFIIGALLLLHLTYLRTAFDPIGAFLDARAVASAESDSQKASALLTINDRALCDLRHLSSEKRFEYGQKKLSARIVANNDQIIAYTNRARQSGVAVRVLLERTEKSLALQHEVLGDTYPDSQELVTLSQQHEYVSDQYSAVLGVQSDASKVHHH